MYTRRETANRLFNFLQNSFIYTVREVGYNRLLEGIC